MSSNNNEMTGIGMGLALVGGALFFAGLVIFAVFTFLACIITVWSLLAWNKPVGIGQWVCEPYEARAFIGGGVGGIIVIPIFVVFCEALLGFQVEQKYWPYIFIASYDIGAFGLVSIVSESQTEAANQGLTLPSAATSRSHELPPPSNTFDYASWDDEEELGK
ncbi:MAG: hypothetical protein N4A65_01210 [Cohaesibacter sp.]|jgi:hypothetical protein|nr:hypothetical protein [Cohaesibacter sp.]